jgi:hypothetical protein
MSTDKEHLQWIYDRLICAHGEPSNVDYMLRFQEIIDSSCDYVVPVEEGPTSTYAIELDETTAQVLTCPECSSTSVGFSSSRFGVTTRKETRGDIEADIIALGFCCEDCGEQWELQAEACTGQRGQALSLTLEIIPKAPCIFPTFVTPSTPTRTLTGLLERFFGESKAA